MNTLNITLPENPDPFAQYLFGVTILSLIALISLLNICIYLFVMFILEKYKIEDKFTIFKNNKILNWIINRYKQTTLIFILIEMILGILSMGTLFSVSVWGIYKYLNH